MEAIKKMKNEAKPQLIFSGVIKGEVNDLIIYQCPYCKQVISVSASFLFHICRDTFFYKANLN